MANTIQGASILQLLRGCLLADSAVQALVENRIHGGWSRSSDWQSIPKPAVALVLNGGTPHNSGALSQQSVDIYTLSATGIDEALAVYGAVRQLLQQGAVALDNVDHRGIMTEQETERCGQLGDSQVWYATGRWLFTGVRDNN